MTAPCGPAGRRRRTAVVALLGVLAVAAGCSGSTAASGPATTGRPGTTAGEPSTTTTTEAAAFPLTGLPGEGLTALRPALIVKIDNTSEYSRPQGGINQADIVFEEEVEGGETRFAAVFQSQDAESVGPIRSARTTDLAIIELFPRPLFSWSGANAAFARLIKEAPIVDVGWSANPSAYVERRDRNRANNLFSSTPKLYALAPEDWEIPRPIFDYRPAGQPLVEPEPEPAPGETTTTVAAIPDLREPLVATRVRVNFTSGERNAREWVWDADAGGWLRFQSGTPHVDEDDRQVVAANVIIQFTDYVDTGFVDTAGSPVPEGQLLGEGDVWVLTDGHLVVGRWSRGTANQPTRYSDMLGQPIRLTPGQTWVQLVRPGGAEVTEPRD